MERKIRAWRVRLFSEHRAARFLPEWVLFGRREPFQEKVFTLVVRAEFFQIFTSLQEYKLQPKFQPKLSVFHAQLHINNPILVAEPCSMQAYRIRRVIHMTLTLITVL